MHGLWWMGRAAMATPAEEQALRDSRVAQAAAVWAAHAGDGKDVLLREGTQSGPLVGADTIAADAAQALGTIVVNRAQQAAFERIRDELLAALRCEPKEGEAAGIDLPRTCDALEALRLEDLATAPGVLLASLTADLVGLALEQAVFVGDHPAAKVLLPFATDFAGGTVVGGLEPGGAGFDPQLGDAATAQLLALAEPLSKDGSALDDAETVIALAGTVVAQCEIERPPDAYGLRTSDCSVARVTQKVGEWFGLSASNPDHVGMLAAARTLANSAWLASNYTEGGLATESAARLRVQHGLDASFGATCLVLNELGDDGVPTPADQQVDLQCSVSGDAAKKTVRYTESWLGVTRPILGAAVNGNGSELATRVVENLPMILKLTQTAVAAGASDSDKKKAAAGAEGREADYERAFAILGSLAGYAVTWVGDDPTSDEADTLRTSILESLTAEFTSRRGREGDTIVSVAGSLNLKAAYRPVGDGWAFDGPISLPIGFGVHGVPKKGPGPIFEASIVDLGQYVTWEEGSGAEVSDPDPAALLSPSLTLGVGWGKQVPFRVGATVGLNPTYGTEGPGAVSGGVVFGMYVPLLDLN